MLFRVWKNMDLEEVNNLTKHTNSKIKSSRNSGYDVDYLLRLYDESADKMV